jgi:hypothetical protein
MADDTQAIDFFALPIRRPLPRPQLPPVATGGTVYQNRKTALLNERSHLGLISELKSETLCVKVSQDEPR